MIGRSRELLRSVSPVCRDAARMISESIDNTLPPLEHIGLRVHLVLCRACRAYRHSLFLLRELMRSEGDLTDAAPTASLPESAKQRILRTIHGC